MKMFVLIPPQRLADTGAIPLVACDNEEFAATHPSVEHYEAFIYSDEDKKDVDGLKLGQSFYDESGWYWKRANDRN